MCQHHFKPSWKKIHKKSSPTCPSTLTFYETLYPLLPPGNPNIIQYLIPGRATNVELLKQVKNWQGPSQDPWSNCLINSIEKAAPFLQPPPSRRQGFWHRKTCPSRSARFRASFYVICGWHLCQTALSFDVGGTVPSRAKWLSQPTRESRTPSGWLARDASGVSSLHVAMPLAQRTLGSGCSVQSSKLHAPLLGSGTSRPSLSTCCKFDIALARILVWR